jgi:hypothetical protein
LVLGRLEADIFPHLGEDDVDGIEARRLSDVIRKIEARSAIETAKRAKNRCSEIFHYGIAEGKCRVIDHSRYIASFRCLLMNQHMVLSRK